MGTVSGVTRTPGAVAEANGTSQAVAGFDLQEHGDASARWPGEDGEADDDCQAEGADAVAAARDLAMRLLAMREHSGLELRRKLERRGHAPAAADQALAALASAGLQSDERFAASYVRTALARGHGEHKIRAALRERGIEPALAAGALALDADAWQQQAKAALGKRFGDAPAATMAEWAKRARFLAGRGFGSAAVAAAVGSRPRQRPE